jgi:SAM-dependent methyltransferase
VLTERSRPTATRSWRSTSPRPPWTAPARAAEVPFERREVPEEFPDGAYDLVVVSEVLYYLDAAAFDATLNAIERTLIAGGVLLAVHWRPNAERHPFTGDEVHERLTARFGPSAHSHRTDTYNLDRFDACGS